MKNLFYRTDNNGNAVIFEKYRDRFYRAFYNTSFSPDRRADSCVKDFSAELQEDLDYLMKETGSVGNYEEKYISHVLTWADRHSRCASSIITGPANFPVARNMKANRSADNAWNDFKAWRKKYIKRATATPTPSPEEDLDKALKDLDKQIEAHDLMKIINKIFRKKSLSLEEQLTEIQETTGCSDDLISRLRIPDEFHGFGFATYALTNSNARIKATKEKVLTMKSRIKTKSEWEPIQFEGGRIDIQANRVVIYHDEKPASEIITALKSRGFRWSRNYGCWCRKHTANALAVAKQICNI